ncbi:hypothetical protein FC17_GL003063 [Secundilactobacillus paracollinoides DSM 15502 = JCM 11969]|nr:hypothetical protein FC17_GL003063 [Secundilactobacillus paracollinoides DSM 15502 = JCM 11969]
MGIDAVECFWPLAFLVSLPKRVQQGKGRPCNGLWQKCQTQAFLLLSAFGF